jgi:hypothetical protein
MGVSEEEAAPQVRIEQAGTVNVPAQGDRLPYVTVIATVSLIVLVCFAAVTFWVLDAAPGSGIDAATKGSVIQTWNNLAIMAAGFWVGSSLAGKLASSSASKAP